MISKREFEERYARRSKMSVDELRALGRRVYPCHCDDETCEGWQSVNPFYYWEDRAMRARGWGKRAWFFLLQRYWARRQGWAERRRRRILKEINR
jgi:hypothetical protein